MGHSGVLKKPNNTVAELLGELQEYSSLPKHVQDQRAGGQQQFLCLCFMKKHQEKQRLQMQGEVLCACRAARPCWSAPFLLVLFFPSGSSLLAPFPPSHPLFVCRTSKGEVRMMDMGWQQLR